jgi:hypothetical protein
MRWEPTLGLLISCGGETGSVGGFMADTATHVWQLSPLGAARRAAAGVGDDDALTALEASITATVQITDTPVEAASSLGSS